MLASSGEEQVHWTSILQICALRHTYSLQSCWYSLCLAVTADKITNKVDNPCSYCPIIHMWHKRSWHPSWFWRFDEVPCHADSLDLVFCAETVAINPSFCVEACTPVVGGVTRLQSPGLWKGYARRHFSISPSKTPICDELRCTTRPLITDVQPRYSTPPSTSLAEGETADRV